MSESLLDNEPFVSRLDAMSRRLGRLLNRPALDYSTATPSKFPEAPGIYIVTGPKGIVVRAGRTNRSLRQRLYQNHLMGSQNGNLPAQLVSGGMVADLPEAKEWIRKNCMVRWLEIDEERERVWLEHFLLAMCQPLFCD